VQAAGSPAIAETSVRIDVTTLEREFRYKSILLDNAFIVKGPLEQFDHVVTVQNTDQEGVVEVSLRGRITSQTVHTR
jgi:hypothetical protein